MYLCWWAPFCDLSHNKLHRFIQRLVVSTAYYIRSSWHEYWPACVWEWSRNNEWNMLLESRYRYVPDLCAFISADNAKDGSCFAVGGIFLALSFDKLPLECPQSICRDVRTETSRFIARYLPLVTFITTFYCYAYQVTRKVAYYYSPISVHNCNCNPP